MTTPTSKAAAQPLEWFSGEYDALNLYPLGERDGGHVWILPRRSYCDRGHWDWGYMGLPMHDNSPTREPSYYFMRRETAVAELEAWMAARFSGEPLHVDNTLAEYAQTFGQKNGQEEGWAWELQGDTRLVTQTQGVRVTLTLDAVEGPEAGVTVNVEGVESLDSADRFPRHYLSVAHAVQETEDFLVWRLLKVPAETPGLIDSGSLPVSSALQQVVDGGEPVAPRRAPKP